MADWVTSGRHAMRPALTRLERAEDVRAELLVWARTLLAGALSPTVVEMRRLVTAEAGRRPEVGATYLHQSWIRNIGDLATTLQTLDARGLLCVPDPATAAQQLTWLVVGAPLNARMLDATAPFPDTVDAAIDVFLAAYRPHPS